ncbi:hypothetical protein [Bradymonas sediminis]|uniref:Uncharacterized protein n=1 Tax=Bradymonas sediminis TaxID=1548548 RepID=A0A2Z4FN27_9DELT|nr:hypothetical protein [Bradymonas sediminis]AWV90369.1 hypothetical protein DN745_13940 [Bradymonas sediminis]TDP72247.1 hypothetical protein DFR33_107231 [Bradymonas sediminis]
MAKRTYAFLFLLFFVFACGDDAPSAKEEIDSSLADLEESSEEYSKEFCVCYADITNNGDMNQCIMEQGTTNPLPTACERDVAECYAEDYTVFIRCATNAIDEFRRCISSCPTSSSQIDSCVNTLNMRQSTCDKNLPADVKIHMDACTSGQKFTCDN